MSRKEDIEARMRALEAERAQLDRYGEDIYDEGDVIKFVKSFKIVRRGNEYVTSEFIATKSFASTRDFTYVALKADGKWFMTGRRDNEGRGMPWDSLVEFMYAGIPVDDITIVIAGDFRTREELERELAELAAKPLPPIEFPEVSIKRGGITFKGVDPREVYQWVEPTLADDERGESVDPSEPVQKNELGGWCAPNAEHAKMLNPESER